jgi:hypothetical protein
MIAGIEYEFCIGRMVSKIGLLTVGATPDLSTAQLRVNELRRTWPGDYIVFDRNTGRVVAKASSPHDPKKSVNNGRDELARRFS